jgi:protein-S-isoprenylcysteine O-methyltransferase Ste14
METGPTEKRLQVAPFAVHATRGVLRDPGPRRKMMTVAIAVSLVLLVTGLTVLRSALDPHEHPLRFVLFWFACGWITVTALLLALLDMLLVRTEARRARRALREQAAAGSQTRPPE